MPYKDKQKANAYWQQYQEEHYTVLGLKLPPDDADMIRRAAKIYKQSNSQFVLTAVREKLLRDGVDPNAEQPEQNNENK